MSFDDRETTWFLAQVKPNSAQIAKNNLSRQGFEIFLPMEEQTHQRSGRFVTAPRPLFPGYIFVAFDVARGMWRTVNSTYGITRLVSFGSEPAPVPRALIGELKMRCDAAGTLLPPERLKAGDRVRMTQGPFANLVAEIETIAPDRRVWLLMDIMGRKTRIAVDPGQIRDA